MQEVAINWWAVLTAVPISLMLGAAWFSPIGFGKLWLKRIGKTPQDFTGAKGAVLGYGAATLGAFLIAYVMATTLEFAETRDAFEGMLGGFFLWLGFVAGPTMANDFMERRPASLWLIVAGFHLVEFVAMGALVGGWQA